MVLLKLTHIDISALISLIFVVLYKQSQLNFAFFDEGHLVVFSFSVMDNASMNIYIYIFLSKNVCRSIFLTLLDIASLPSKIVLNYTPTISYNIPHCSTSVPTLGVARLFNVCQSDCCEMISYYSFNLCLFDCGKAEFSGIFIGPSSLILFWIAC